MFFAVRGMPKRIICYPEGEHVGTDLSIDHPELLSVEEFVEKFRNSLEGVHRLLTSKQE